MKNIGILITVQVARQIVFCFHYCFHPPPPHPELSLLLSSHSLPPVLTPPLVSDCGTPSAASPPEGMTRVFFFVSVFFFFFKKTEFLDKPLKNTHQLWNIDILRSFSNRNEALMIIWPTFESKLSPPTTPTLNVFCFIKYHYHPHP